MSQKSSEISSQASILSDISSFAEWEFLHPESLAQEDSREASVLAGDMARHERIWKDRDSSNDARSSDEEEEIELPAVKKGKKEKRGKLSRTVNTASKKEIEVVKDSQETQSQDLVSTVLRRQSVLHYGVFKLMFMFRDRILLRRLRVNPVLRVLKMKTRRRREVGLLLLKMSRWGMLTMLKLPVMTPEIKNLPPKTVT